MRRRDARLGQSALIDIGHEKFHRHCLQDAQMVCAPATETDEKNAFHRAELVAIDLWALVNRHNFLADRFAHVFTERTIKAIVFELFENLGAPAGTARDRKHRCEQVRRNA